MDTLTVREFSQKVLEAEVSAIVELMEFFALSFILIIGTIGGLLFLLWIVDR